MRLIFHPAVRQDIASIREWYVSQNPALSDALAADFDAAIARVGRHPQMYVQIEGFHRVRLGRFPCHIYYLVSGSDVYILGVADARAEPVASFARMTSRLF